MPKCDFYKKLLFTFIEITLRYGCSVNLLHISRIPFYQNTSGGLLLAILLYMLQI